jgi:hypothetical protein
MDGDNSGNLLDDIDDATNPFAYYCNNNGNADGTEHTIKLHHSN